MKRLDALRKMQETKRESDTCVVVESLILYQALAAARWAGDLVAAGEIQAKLDRLSETKEN